MRRPVCRVLTGPTASGKSALALRLAQKMGWEILCMDSMQIYRGMDIGTAKPTPQERQAVPHHLLDLRDPREGFTVSDYREAAEQTVDRLHGEGREVLFVGGTVLYLQALMHPMAMGNVPPDPALRDALRRLAETEQGKQALAERLRSLDPETARRLPLNDVRRIIRAIEVSEATGIPFSRQPDREGPARYEWRVVSTAMERDRLYARINRRAEVMLREGLQEEVAGLLAAGVPENAQSMQGLGYKEMIPVVRGRASPEEALEAIRTGSRHYAKRQMTFLRREPAVRYVDAERPDAGDRILAMLETETDGSPAL